MTALKPSWLGRLCSRLTGHVPSRPHRRTQARLSLEQLEDRTVPTASFGSAVGIGSAGLDGAFDVATDAAGNVYHAGYFSGTVDFDPAATHAGDTDVCTAAYGQNIYVAKYAPDGSFLWVRAMTGVDASSADGVARTITTDANGAVYIAGDFKGTINVGPYTLNSAGDKDAFVAKLAPDGTVLWAQSWGGALSREYALGVAVDGAGNVLTAGYTIQDGSYNLQVNKFSPTGALLWAKQIGNTSGGQETAYGIGTDAAGNVYLTGGFKGTVDFDPGPGAKNVTGGPNVNGYVLKLTAAGNFGWVSPFVSTTGTSSCRDLVVDGAGNILVGGSYSGSVDFKPGNGTYTLPYPTYNNGFVEKLNSAGNLVWAQRVGGEIVRSLALDAAGNVYVQGQFSGQADFDPGAGTTVLTSHGSNDVYVTKFSAAGAFAWAVSFGGPELDFSSGVAVDANRNVYVAGFYYDTADFDPDPLGTHELSSAGANDIFLVKLRQS